MFVSDLRGKILDRGVTRNVRLNPGSASGETIPTTLNASALREVVERGVTRNVRLNPRSASGEVIPTTVNASALRDPDGTVIFERFRQGDRASVVPGSGWRSCAASSSCTGGSCARRAGATGKAPRSRSSCRP